ncbi:hypothetical protein RBH29_08275 [Herbivorax sp. ANBcel31]|uniref:DUF6873 family GME fold protein n=1 Tax=Herbivorax sp. ANBcel31 TaxID=3069754 RepID=UPI0027AE3C9E|nr:hypothetical protein [Herbivorax sp. ANBcel31]MDQ2086425.1 hypothetical protein [Herbivorax sp. ANBcel31]
MNFLDNANLPKKKVNLVLVDGRINYDLEKSFLMLGINHIKTKPLYPLYQAISCHPDIIFHHLEKNVIVYAPGICKKILKKLYDFGFELLEGKCELGSKYPKNICYNGARIGNYFFHNIKYTDDVIMKYLKKIGVEIVHVNQGYAKCSISVVDERSLITMDKGIAKAAEKKGLDVLLIEEDGILLEGMDKGFIGGSTCLIDKNKWAICGNIEMLKSEKKLRDFLYRKRVEIICLGNKNPVDVGSVIPILTD